MPRVKHTKAEMVEIRRRQAEQAARAREARKCFICGEAVIEFYGGRLNFETTWEGVPVVVETVRPAHQDCLEQQTNREKLDAAYDEAAVFGAERERAPDLTGDAEKDAAIWQRYVTMRQRRDAGKLMHFAAPDEIAQWHTDLAMMSVPPPSPLRQPDLLTPIPFRQRTTTPESE